MAGHYFNTIENSVTGRPVAGASVRVLDALGALATIYSDDGVTVADNPLHTDSLGFFDFWTNETKVTLSIGYDGVTQRTIADVDIIGGTMAGDVTAIAVRMDAAEADLLTKAELSALAATTGSSLVGFLPAGTGAVARTAQAKLRDTINVRDFGAVGDGVTDDAPAFNLAIAHLNTISTAATLVVRGNFLVNGSLTPITTSRKVIDGYGSTITHDGGTLFSFGVNGSHGMILGIRYLTNAVSPTAGTCFLSIEGAMQCVVRDISGRVVSLAKIGLTNFVGGYLFDNINVGTYNGGQVIIDHGQGAVSQIKNLVLTANGTNRVIDETTLTNATATGIRFFDNWDTMVWDGLLINGYLYGLDVNRTAANVNISNARVSNFYFDFCANGIRMKNTALGGGINNWYFVNGWAVGMDGYSINIDGGIFANLKFVNVQAFLAGKSNWRLNPGTDGSYSHITLENCAGMFANRFNATNTGTDQDDFVAVTGNFRVFNSRFGQTADGFAAAGVPNWQARYGMTISPNIINYVIQGNQLSGKTANCSFNFVANKLPAGNEFSSYIRDNTVFGGAVRPAYATTDTLTAPTSGVTQTNDTPFTFSLYVYGGTFTNLTHNGAAVSAGTPVTLIVQPGDTWMVSYTVAPTIRRVVQR